MTIPYTPGVVVHEIPSQNKPIEGVATSVVGFVGRAPGGPVNVPMEISSWTQFARIFGDPADAIRTPPERPKGPFMEGAYLAHAVYGFFLNGNGVCWVVRVADERASDVAQVGLLNAGENEMFSVIALPGATDVSVDVAEDPPPQAADPTAGVALTPASTAAGGHPTFTVRVTSGDKTEEFPAVTVVPGPKYLPTVINTSSELVRVADTGSLLPASNRVLQSAEGLKPAKRQNPALAPEDLRGSPDQRTGIWALSTAHGVTTVCVPDAMSIAVDDAGNPDAEELTEIQNEVSAFCQAHGAMAIFDPPPLAITPQEVKAYRTGAPSNRFTTLYWPWIKVSNPLGGDPIAVPPSGHVAGVWARTDEERGVFKAPANEELRGAVDLAYHVDDTEQSDMNQRGINAIRFFPGRGIRIWGARTLSGEVEPEWTYLNVRRLFNYLSASILRGTQWAVFEPNDEALWVSLRVSVSNFLTTVWRTGALFGASPSEAFFVKCDAETNPPEERDIGKVNIVVGVAPVKPAEFVIFQISQYQATAA
ncbi:MAG TPA: phage tail sheath subtilisin-like domain-containing protein [Solirubrobacteraceae bacterium]|nr:phage tail sheath subtilisin-like domain-containing protein [Solirubrobacteraceae bacterium]